MIEKTLVNGEIKNGYITIPANCGLFDESEYGGPTDSDAGREFELILLDGSSVHTDIRTAGGNSSGSGRFRHRFYSIFKKDARYRVGTLLTIRKIGDGKYCMQLKEGEKGNFQAPAGDPTTASEKVQNGIMLNTILYGPPGTGKTYATAELAVKIADPEFYQEVALTPDAQERRKEIKVRYDDLVASNRVGFSTFHQSFCYEDFIEGIRAKTSDDGGGLVYEVEDGIFKKLAALAGSHSSDIVVGHSLALEGRRIWKMSLGNTQEDSDEGYQNCLERGYIGLGWGQDIDFRGCDSREDVSRNYSSVTGETYDHTAYNVNAVNTFKNVISKGDLVVVSDGNHKFRAIAEVTDDYEFSVDDEYSFFQRRGVNWLQQFEPSLPKEALFKKSLSQMTLYELKPKTIMMDRLQEFLSVPTDTSSPVRNYVLILDEINRGNIARIFGELITLLEPDKRKNGADERSVILPYSKEHFTVPENLYVIGTMNTADKSLAQLDLALRRRFDFIEVMPNAALLEGVEVYGVSVDNLLEIINARIEVLLDRDHLIGHSYFLPLKQAGANKERLMASIFENRIIPLLQEYFFSDWEKIGWVLNDIDKPWDERFVQLEHNNVASTPLFSSKVADDLQDRRYQINASAFTNAGAYRGILLGNKPE